jgi:hypothetical protein
VTDAQKNSEYFTSIQVSASGGEPAQAGSVSGPIGTEVADLLRTLIEQNRELIQLGRQQVELGRRMDDRYEKQMQAQREEFVRWLEDIPGLTARGKEATEAVRILLGRVIDEMVDYVKEHDEQLEGSDFVRSELVDRYGQLLNHVSAMYGLLKRLSTADESPR